MRKIPTTSLRPGQKVGRPVFNSSGQMLLNKDAILTEKHIKRLHLLGIPALYIDDGFLPDVEIDDIISEQTRLKTIKQVKNIFENHGKKNTQCGGSIITNKETITTVYEIIDQLLENNSLVVNLIDIRAADDYTFAHSVNVCVLSTLTGISMGLARSQLFHLAMGGLFHDIGKMYISPQILNKPGPLTSEEFIEIKKHTVLGYNILKNEPSINIVSALTAYQHHERYNGEGYPQGLKKDEIHLFSRIVGMVDMYDAITADRVYRKAYPPNEAYEMILGAGNFLFDYKIINPFLKNVAAYPTGNIVQLSTGEIAVVVDNLPEYSLYPKVRILFSPDMEAINETIEIFLFEHTNITITKILDETEFLPYKLKFIES